MEDSLVLESYISQKSQWPSIGKTIVAQFDEFSIILYQAYSPTIAIPLLETQSFLSSPGFELERMTWFKPNFLWMMHRSDWGRAKNQESIIAFKVRRDWFERCLLEARLSGKDKNCRTGRVVVQWDPHHGPNGGKCSQRRCIQIGIRKERALEWAQGVNGPAILRAIDANDIVKEAYRMKTETDDFLMPRERTLLFHAPNIDLLNS